MNQSANSQGFIVEIGDLFQKFWMNLSSDEVMSRLPSVSNRTNMLHAVHINLMFVVPALNINTKLYADFCNDAFDHELYILNNQLNSMTPHEVSLLKAAYMEFALGFYFRVIEYKLPLHYGYYAHEDANDKLATIRWYPNN